MTDTTQADAEEARAALYRRQRARRVQFQLSTWKSLAGSPSATVAFHQRWQPLVDYLAERQLPEADPQLEIDPFGISDTVNVGR